MKFLELDIQRFAGGGDFIDFYANGHYLTTLYWGYDPVTQKPCLDGEPPVITDDDLADYGFDLTKYNHFMGWHLTGYGVPSMDLTPQELIDYRDADAYDYTQASAWVIDGSAYKDGIIFVGDKIEDITFGGEPVMKVIYNGDVLWKREL